MMLLRGLMLVWSLLSVGTSYAADCGKIPVDFYLVSTETLLGSVGVIPQSKIDPIIKKLSLNANANIGWIREETQNRIDFCMGQVRVLGIRDMLDFVPFAIDKEFWTQVEKEASNGTLNPTQIKRARKEVERICGLVKLITSEFLDYLGGGPVGYPITNPGNPSPPESPVPVPMPRILASAQRLSKEVPINVLIDQCYTFGRPLGLKDKARGLSQSNSIMDLIFHVVEQVMELFGMTHQGRTHFNNFSDVEVRKKEAPFLREFRRGIHLQMLSSHDETLLHEIGHYLGLPHVAGGPILSWCPDNDDPPVRDTPGMPQGERDDYGEYAKMPPSKWPKSCAPVRNSAGNILDDRYPLDNRMLQGSDVDFKIRFTEGQLEVMERMVDMLVR